jgi:lipopolysaccharide/colanic/teichoic acid biosynthesis glycosyltransferase
MDRKAGVVRHAGTDLMGRVHRPAPTTPASLAQVGQVDGDDTHGSGVAGRQRVQVSSLATHQRVATTEGTVGPGPTVLYGSIAGPNEARVLNRYERVVKPAMDRVLALVMLLVLSPVFAFIAVAIRTTMGRGVIFQQQRVGQNGRLFTLYKFRTMRPDRRLRPGLPINGQERRRTHKSPFHPLVTPVGRVLRKLSVDELPQLWNVLCGQMSMVGPRPELPWIVDGYEAWQHRRHLVKPGLTGLWQVTTRGDGVMHDRTDVDLEYLERVSFHRDLWIMLRTIPVMLARRGSY